MLEKQLREYFELKEKAASIKKQLETAEQARDHAIRKIMEGRSREASNDFVINIDYVDYYVHVNYGANQVTFKEVKVFK